MRDHCESGSTPSVLIGRDHELSVLLDAGRAAPALILVEGEAGIGKSALVRETVCHPSMRRARVLLGHCQRMREPFPLAPVVEGLCGLGTKPPTQSLSAVVGALRPLLPEIADVLPAQPAALGDPRAQRHQIFRALRELLAALGPTVCILEDLHWADESTLDFVAFLVSDPPEHLSLMLTYRSEELPLSSSLPALPAGLPPHVRHATIRVSPLSVEEVGRLSCALLKTSALSEELVRHLHDQTAGIPFALEEVVRLHRGQLELVDGWRTVDELDHMAVPPTVGHSLRERMASLTSDARLVARAVAVLGSPADEELVAKVAGVSAIRTSKALSRVLSAAVLEEHGDDLYGFLHALAAQAVYDEIPRPERRRLHRRAVEALQAGPEPLPIAQLAHHAKEAGCDRRWARYAEAAADAASAIGDDRSAARLLEQALGASGLSRAARLRMALRLGTAALHSPEPERAIAWLERVRDEDAVAAGVRGELRYRIARLRYQSGDTGAWREEMQRAIEDLRDQPTLAAHAMITLAWPVVGQGHVAHDLAWLDRAVQTSARADDQAVESAIAGQRAAILLCVGDPRGWSAAERIPRRGHCIDENMQLLSVYQSLSSTAIALGHFKRAESFLGEVARLADELPHVAWAPWLDSARASLDWRTGRWEGLEQRLRVLSERGTGGPALAIANEMILAALLLGGGRIRDAEQSFQAVLARAEPRGWMGALTAAATGLAQIRLARGHVIAAIEMASRGLEVLERKGIWIWGRELVPVAVQANLASGDADTASALADRFTAGVQGRDAPAAEAAARFCEAAIAASDGRCADAARAFASAERISSALPAPYEAARARAARARCLITAGDEQGADALLGALKSFDDLGAAWDAAQVRADLRTHRIPVPSQWRGGRRSYGDELSPREVEVADLARTGCKNREIAESLFISQRTVETHVASILRKLGVPSREALASVHTERLATLSNR